MPIKPLFNESDLLAEIAVGNERAFRILYDKYKKKIYTYALGLLHTDVLAEEVMQEVFLKLWRVGDSLQVINNLEAYLKTITRNLCMDAFRKVVIERKSDHELTRNYIDSHNETEESILLNDTRQILNEAIASLPQQQREVYLLCQNEGLKYDEVATRLNISTNTVKTHMKRALSSLRAYMKLHTDVMVVLILFKLL